MARPIKSERKNLVSEIMFCAWEEIRKVGAGNLSLREIARQLGISAPAIYHYFPNYDALVTALVIDAYTSLRNSQLRCQEQNRHGELRQQLWSLGGAYRDWALAHPAHYLLIFGSPVPGYQIPKDLVFPPEAYAMVPLMETLQTIKNAGMLASQDFSTRASELTVGLHYWAGGAAIELEALYASLAIWNHIHGLIMLEITSLLPFSPEASQIFFEIELEVCVNRHLKKKA